MKTQIPNLGIWEEGSAIWPPGTLKHHQESGWFSAVFSNEPWLSQPLHMLFPLPGTFSPEQLLCRNRLKGHFFGGDLPSSKIGL